MSVEPAVPPVPVVGCDVVDVARMRRLLAERPGAAEHLFTASELADAQRGGVALDGDVAVERLAARFAAKEATRKALGGRGPGLRSIEVRTDDLGAPSVWIDGQPSGLACSLSHDAGVAIAVVVGLG
jgi:holo-[acyl-carrier protein] synthase